MKSVLDKVLASIKSKGRGFAFSGKDFLHLGPRTSVDHALSTLATKGEIRRLHRGIYDYPHFDEQLGGQLSPDVDAVAKAIARKTGVRIQASGAWAANLLGLSTQVSAKILYLTDGTSRKYCIGSQTIDFKRVGPKDLIGKREASSLVAQALRYLGKDRVNEQMIKQLRRRLTEADCKALPADLRYSADWIYEVAKKIAHTSGAANAQSSNT